MTTRTVDKFLLLVQRCVPARLIGGLMRWLTRIETKWFKNVFIEGFAALYNVNTSEAARPVPDGYRHFNEFFTRELAAGLRPQPEDPRSFSCPADGTLARTGYAREGHLFQAKGIDYSLEALLGDAAQAYLLADAPFTTVYLAPYDYHRLHMPWSGTLRTTRFIPGRLYSVNARTTSTLPGLYTVNERLVCDFESPEGPFSLVFVGAMNVASMSTAWSGDVPAYDEIVETDHQQDDIHLERGDYVGHFNMGSTIVCIGPTADLQWQSDIRAGRTVRVGEPLGRL